MEEALGNVKESPYSACAKGMNESYSVKNSRRIEIKLANKLPDIPISSGAQASEYVHHLSL
jgi:hypothetical protein